MKNKNLGQHFLKNQLAIKKMITALNLQPNDTVIEIGSGKGALTFPLAEKCQRTGCKLVAIEKDPQLAKKLETRIQNVELNNTKIIYGDALKIISTFYFLDSKFYKIVGNIPYYITGKLLRILGELITNNQLPITNIVLMIQKEVAERLAAKPPETNLLAAAIQFWAEPKILFSLKPNDFDPPPKVKSSVIQLTTYDQRPTTKESENYYKLIKILFKQPRKTIVNNLATSLKLSKNEIENLLKSYKIDPHNRPQNLSVKQIINLTRSDLIRFIPKVNLENQKGLIL